MSKYALIFLAACGPVCPPGQHVERQNCHARFYMLCTMYGKYGCEIQIPMTTTECDSVCVGEIQAEAL